MNIGHGAQSKKGSYDTGLYKLLGFVLYEVNFQKQKIKHYVNFDVSLLH